MERRLRFATVALAVVGAAIAAYLSYVRITDSSIMCPTSGCATVQRSAYSSLAGVPVAYLGVFGYLAIAAAAALPGRRARIAATALTLAAALFATYLLVAQLAWIHAVCTWCLASDGVLATLVAVTALRRRAVVVAAVAAVVLAAAVPASAAASRTVVVYEPHGASATCTRVFPLARTVTSRTVLAGALRALLAGPTRAERAAGFGGWFSAKTAGHLRSVRLAGGTAYVDFRSFAGDIPSASSSCGSALLLAQLDRTARQFASVRRTVYSFDGSSRAFYEWLQRPVPGIER